MFSPNLLASSAAATLAIIAFVAVPVGTALAQDAEAGARVFRRCAACHTLEEGGKSTAGPNLHGIMGSVSGSRETGFRYSDALKDAAVVWDDANLDQWIAGPRKFIPGSRMTISVADEQQRQDLIAYLKENTQ